MDHMAGASSVWGTPNRPGFALHVLEFDVAEFYFNELRKGNFSVGKVME